MISFACAQCTYPITQPDCKAGESVSCPGCADPQLVPQQGSGKEEAGLGEYLGEHVPQVDRLSMGTMVALAVTTLALILVFVMIGVAAFRRTELGTLAITGIMILGSILIAAIMAAITWIFVRRSARKAPKWLFFFQDGLVWLQDGIQRIYRWQQIQNFYQAHTEHSVGVANVGAAPIGVSRRYRITWQDGQTVTFNSASGWNEHINGIAEHIQDRCTEQWLGSSLQGIQDGREMRFGPELCCNSTGIVYSGMMGQAQISWDELGKAYVEEGCLVFRKKDGWANYGNIKVSRIANLKLLLAVIEKKLSGQ